MKRARLSYRIIVGALLVAADGQAAQAEPLRVFHFTWVGYGPLFVAQEKGLFAREGVEVALIKNDDHTAAFAGLATRQADAIAGGLQDAAVFAAPGEEPLVCVLAMDDSRGADGILAATDIQTIADLEGRSVAVLRGGIPHFYLSFLLRDAGLGEGDIEVVDLSGEDAAQAFLLGEDVDAAVTYEPWLTQGRQAGHGHLLTDTNEQPGLLVDCLITRPAIFAERLADFRALARAWDVAVHYVAANPDEAAEIMARHVGGWLEDPAVFAETLKGVRFYDAASNRAYFGTPEQPGPIHDILEKAIEVWASLGVLDVELTPADVIRHDLWAGDPVEAQ
jgi:NitT/TauT family transport system substrate-binding protein